MGKYRPDLVNRQKAAQRKTKQVKELIKKAIKGVESYLGVKPQVWISLAVPRASKDLAEVIGIGLADHFNCQVSHWDKLSSSPAISDSSWSEPEDDGEFLSFEVDFASSRGYELGPGTAINHWVDQQLVRAHSKFESGIEKLIITLKPFKAFDFNQPFLSRVLMYFCERVTSMWTLEAKPREPSWRVQLSNFQDRRYRCFVQEQLLFNLPDPDLQSLLDSQREKLTKKLFNEAKKAIDRFYESSTADACRISLEWSNRYDARLAKAVGKRLAHHYDCRVQRTKRLRFTLYLDSPKSYDRGLDFGSRSEIASWLSDQVLSAEEQIEQLLADALAQKWLGNPAPRMLTLEIDRFSTKDQDLAYFVRRRFCRRVAKKSGCLVWLSGSTLTVYHSMLT